MRAPTFWTRDGLIARMLDPVGRAYDFAGRLREAAITPQKASVPVLCVGNLVAGGAGKTPVALALLRELTGRGIQAHALSRGYGGRKPGPLRVDPVHHDAAAVGDEALLLARAAPTWVARNRPKGASAAASAGAEAIVLDDGFQNPALYKDLSLLVIDGAYGFGNGRILPAGPLREHAARALARADAVVLMGEDRQALSSRFGDLPVLSARLVPSSGGANLAGRAVLAFAGIARPEKFFATLAELEARMVETKTFPDHHAYQPSEVDSLLQHARALGATPVTTAKDAVRLSPPRRREVTVLEVKVSWDDPDALASLLDRVFPAR